MKNPIIARRVVQATRRKVGIGIIGVGRIGQLAHLANFVCVKGCRVVAVADQRPILVRRASRLFGVTRCYLTHHELLADPDVEAVVVVTRRAATGPIVIDALRAGRHVLSEKPMALSLAQALRLVNEASSRSLIYGVGYMKRHDPGVQKAKQSLTQSSLRSALGDLLQVRAFSFGGDAQIPKVGYVMTKEARPDGIEVWPVGPDWLPDELRTPFESFVNVHVHILNLIRFFLQKRIDVSHAQFVGTQCAAASCLAGDIPVTFEFASRDAGSWSEGVEFTFSKGALTVNLPAPFAQNEIARVLLQLARKPVKLLKPRRQLWAFNAQAEAFVNVVKQNRCSIADGKDSADDLRIVEDIWKLHPMLSSRCAIV